MRPIIGRSYWPNPTLRQMPRGWYLSCEQKRPYSFRRRWYQNTDTQVAIGILAAGLALCLITMLGLA